MLRYGSFYAIIDCINLIKLNYLYVKVMYIEYLLYVVNIIHIFIVTHVNRIYLSLIETPQPRIVSSRLNQNGHLTNSTTLPLVGYVCYMV